MFNILILGHSGSGKTTAAKIVAKLMGSPPPKNCSDFIIEDFAKENDLNPREVLKNKEEHRQDLFKYGLKRQSIDPAYPVTEAFKHSKVVTGVRTKENLEATKKAIKQLIVIWISSVVGKGSTDQLGPEHADKVIENNGTIDDLKIKLVAMMTGETV